LLFFKLQQKNVSCNFSLQIKRNLLIVIVIVEFVIDNFYEE